MAIFHFVKRQVRPSNVEKILHAGPAGSNKATGTEAKKNTRVDFAAAHARLEAKKTSLADFMQRRAASLLASKARSSGNISGAKAAVATKPSTAEVSPAPITAKRKEPEQNNNDKSVSTEVIEQANAGSQQQPPEAKKPRISTTQELAPSTTEHSASSSCGSSVLPEALSVPKAQEPEDSKKTRLSYTPHKGPLRPYTFNSTPLFNSTPTSASKKRPLLNNSNKSVLLATPTAGLLNDENIINPNKVNVKAKGVLDVIATPMKQPLATQRQAKKFVFSSTDKKATKQAELAKQQRRHTLADKRQVLVEMRDPSAINNSTASK